MKRFVTLAAMVLLLAGFSTSDLRREMVALDRVYIAALALTSQGKVAASRKAVHALSQAWADFARRNYDANPDDLQWRADFNAVGKRVNEAVTTVSSPATDLARAHEVLEDVRNVLMSLRRRNRIDYYIDGLTAFHHPMEDIVLAAKDKSAQTLSDADIGGIRNMLQQADVRWQAVEATPPDTDVYRLSASQEQDVITLVKLERSALESLKVALNSGNKAQIVAAAVGIKPNFAKLFMTFADFRPYQD